MTQTNIRSAAQRLIDAKGLINLTKTTLCEAAGVPVGSFSHIMGESFEDFVRAQATIQREDYLGEVDRTRVDPKLRKAQITQAALSCAEINGFYKLTRGSVASWAGVSLATVQRYFPGMEVLLASTMNLAVQKRIIPVVAQGLSAGSPVALSADSELRAACADYIGSRTT
ncbi:hypothetical protein N9937_01510 [bacterium]|nr:hypothetical protein [bacterium]